MILYFSKQEFNKNTCRNCKQKLNGHLDILDGMEVDFTDGDFGIVPEYVVHGEHYYLYPVSIDWCSTEKQEKLF